MNFGARGRLEGGYWTVAYLKKQGEAIHMNLRCGRKAEEEMKVVVVLKALKQREKIQLKKKNGKAENADLVCILLSFNFPIKLFLNKCIH